MPAAVRATATAEEELIGQIGRPSSYRLSAMHESARTARARAASGDGSGAIRLVGAFAMSAGVIHGVALIQHLSENWRYIVFFAGVAPCQALWGIWLYRHPFERRLLVAGAIANLVIVAIWALSRTTGIPVVPALRAPEGAGLLDLFATFDELAIAALAVAVMQPAGRVRARLAYLSAAQQARVGSALVSGTLVGIMLGAHAH